VRHEVTRVLINMATISQMC